MKPRTLLQKEITKLSKNLPKLTKAQAKFAFDKCFEHYGKISKNGIITCLECANQWKSKHTSFEDTDYCVCPKCGKKIKVLHTKKRVFKDKEYFSIITTKDKFQVIRFFSTTVSRKAGVPSDYSITEVVQQWIAPNGKSEVIARLRCMGSIYYDLWNLGSPMEIRKSNQYFIYNIYPYKTYPRIRVIPEIKRNGYKKSILGVTPHDLFTAILREPQMETLLKAGQDDLFAHFTKVGNISKYWESIKICIRNKYKITDASMWIDYLNLLREFGKDTNNPKYICPSDLQKKHDKLVAKKEEVRKREELARALEQIQIHEDKYKQSKGKFFGLLFTDGMIRLRVLESVKEFAEEGISMHHCVFASKYFLKDDALVFSATIDGKRIETVEFSLSKMKVVQSRGVQNKNTEYHDRIINLVNINMNQIAKRMAV